jgi:YD repeat-containing protein
MKRIWYRSAFAALVATLALPSASFAIVDMKNANYADSWLDLSLTGTGYSLKVQRFYNSRSVFSGIFGFGWCSDFETSVEKTPEGRLKLVECGAGQEVIYAPAKFDNKNVDKLIDQMVAHYKKTTPGASRDGGEVLREQLRDDSELRSIWAKAAGISVPEVKKGVVYRAENLEVEQIVWDGSTYTRTLADGTSQKFETSGRLSYVYDKNGNYLKMTYGPDSLKEVVDNTGKKLTFVFTNKRVKEINGPNGVKVDYKFKGEDLVEVKNMWKNAYAYSYAENHNLTRINFPDGTFKALTYNEKDDWVTSFTDRAVNGVACTETYKYEMDKANPKDHYWSTAIKKCGAEIKNEARFEFWHKARGDGQKYLSRVLTKSMTDSLDVSYHPEFGRPTAIKKNNVTTTFEYYPNGLIREKTTASARLIYEYKNDHNKVSKVVADFLDPKGKVLRKRDTNFNYDTKGNLIMAQNSDGQLVKLTYDSRGRIATITDQAKKEVLIKYEERTGKPSTITRPQVGAINVSYKANGEINKVESSDGPTVAVQIASTFNNLLDIIAPATSELNL